MHMDFSFAHIQCWRREGKRPKGVHLPASLLPHSRRGRVAQMERDCVSAPNTWLHVCFVTKKRGMEQGHAAPLAPGMDTRCMLMLPQTVRGTTAASGWFSKHSTRDRFRHELILPRLETLSWLFLLLCYLCYPKMWASKNVSPGTCRVVPFSQEYSQRTSSLPPLL